MAVRHANVDLKKVQSEIAKKVRELRLARRLTQAELAKLLGTSQSRLSEIEKGAGSFTAEQFLLLLQFFNVTLSHFAPPNTRRQDAERQNALARLGAIHLHESRDVLPSEQLEQVGDVVRETLIAAESPRQITALAPVLVRNIDRISLKKLHGQFVASGLEHRFAWLLENTLEAVRRELPTAMPRPWAQATRRAEVALSMYLNYLLLNQPAIPSEPRIRDILDSDIRSQKSLQVVIAVASKISQHWGIATTLQPEDFAEALRASRAVD